MPGPGLARTFLGKLDPSLRARLEPLLEPVSLRTDQVLIAPNHPIEHVYFLRSGLATISCLGAGRQTSVALVGPETFSGHCLMLGRDRSTRRTQMQIAGLGYRMRAVDLKRMADQEPAFRLALLHCVDDLMQQFAEAAFANAQLTVESRLARLLLMAADRLGSGDLRLTHDRIALMLGCRRAGVTMSIHLLEGEHAIRATRAHICLLDRARLREVAGSSYHGAEAEPRDAVIPAPLAEAQPAPM
ncbi:MAG: cAMP-binding protein [Hyphomicrobiales bacterium]|nr:cAMP-binding protein [Hyphomicrobiales bacterium]